MEESILTPSPNWFYTNGIAASKDGWLLYGGPNKCLCVLKPLPPDCNSVVAGERAYKTHIFHRAHKEKIVCVDISPEWPEKRLLLTSGADGVVKQWELQVENNKLEMITTHNHDKHFDEKEEVIGAGYSTEVIALTVGSLGCVFKWNLSSNVVQRYGNMMKNFKPLCMTCSPHLPLHLAVGTKQGVIIVMNLDGSGKVLYKVRGHDDEILNLSWCPKYEVIVKKSMREVKNKNSLSQRLENIRNVPCNDACEDNTSENNEIAPVNAVKINGNEQSILETSGGATSLPEDSFGESVVVEDDTFDIYKDHEADEFGHRKYEPEDIVVRVKEEEGKDDFLTECVKLKDDILKRKDAPESTIESLVEAMDKTHVQEQDGNKTEEEYKTNGLSTSEKNPIYISHCHKHLLATVAKSGAFKVWSKAGKLVGSGLLQNKSFKNQKFNKGPYWPTLLWYKPDKIIIADGKFNLFECKALEIDCSNKMETSLLHTNHRRSPYCVISDAPRVQNSDGDWSIYTAAQDRYIIKYCMKEQKTLAILATSGGYIYSIQSCPYDAGKVAISVGDGAVRVWESSTLDEDETRLSPGRTTHYWQNVQGKVLSIAWHPTKENLLAFATAEARVGLIDTSGRSEKPARVLYPAVSRAIYALSWGENNDLYVCCSGMYVVYNSLKPDEAPEPITVMVESQHWDLTEARWHQRGITVGAMNGGVAILAPAKPYDVYAAQFVFKKLIHCIEWHPQEISDSNKESPYKNLLAVCAMEKTNGIVILELKEKEGGHELVTYKTLYGHQCVVIRLVWSPHKNGQLLSSSQDATVRAWDVASGACLSIFDSHTQGSIAVAWCAFPQLGTKVLTGGADYTVRLWDVDDYPAAAFSGVQKTQRKQIRRPKIRHENVKSKSKANGEQDASKDQAHKAAASLEQRLKVSKKFLLPLSYRQMQDEKSLGIRKLLQAHFDKIGVEARLLEDVPAESSDLEYIKMFGNTNEINELLDIELQRHLKSSNPEGWMVLNLFRGHVDTVIQHAVEKDRLCPFLMSVAPCVSVRYWKDVMQLYVAQIDRLVAKADDSRLYESRHYGGPTYRKVISLLSIHDVKKAVDTLLEARLFKEAYILCRIRHMESVAEEILKNWAKDAEITGNFTTSAICYAVLGDPSNAALVLSKSSCQESLRLAADIAKAAGHNTLAEHIESLAKTKLEEAAANGDDSKDLPALLSKAEALAADDQSSDEIDSDDDE